MKKCYFKDCGQPPTILCRCDKTMLMCSYHFQYHSMETGKEHSEMPISMLQQSTAISSAQILQQKSQIENISNQIRISTNTLITGIQNLHDLAISSLRANDKFLDYLLEALTNNIELDFGAMMQVISIPNPKVLEESDLLDKIQLFYSDKYGIDSKIRWVLDNYLFEFSVINENTVFTPLPQNHPLGQFGQIIEIGVDKQIYYGGIKNKKPIGTCVAYNGITKEFQYFKPGKPRFYAASGSYKGKIYFYGGLCLNSLSDCQILSLSNHWEDGPQMPEPSTLCVCSEFKGIWLSGYDMEQIYYHSVENSSYTSYMALQKTTYKYVFTINEQIYIINNDKLWRLCKNKWTKSNLNVNLQGAMVSTLKVLGKYAYFALFTDKVIIKKLDFENSVII